MKQISLLEAIEYGLTRKIVKSSGDAYGQLVLFEDGSSIEIEVEDGIYWSALTGQDPATMSIILKEPLK